MVKKIIKDDESKTFVELGGKKIFLINMNKIHKTYLDDHLITYIYQKFNPETVEESTVFLFYAKNRKFKFLEKFTDVNKAIDFSEKFVKDYGIKNRRNLIGETFLFSRKKAKYRNTFQIVKIDDKTSKYFNFEKYSLLEKGIVRNVKIYKAEKQTYDFEMHKYSKFYTELICYDYFGKKLNFNSKNITDEDFIIIKPRNKHKKYLSRDMIISGITEASTLRNNYVLEIEKAIKSIIDIDKKINSLSEKIKDTPEDLFLSKSKYKKSLN